MTNKTKKLFGLFQRKNKELIVLTPIRYNKLMKRIKFFKESEVY